MRYFNAWHPAFGICPGWYEWNTFVYDSWELHKEVFGSDLVQLFRFYSKPLIICVSKRTIEVLSVLEANNEIATEKLQFFSMALWPPSKSGFFNRLLLAIWPTHLNKMNLSDELKQNIDVISQLLFSLTWTFRNEIIPFTPFPMVNFIDDFILFKCWRHEGIVLVRPSMLPEGKSIANLSKL